MGDEFIDAEEYSGKQKEASFRGIILNHISKISQIATTEFRAGYWNKKPQGTAGGVYMSETYVEDKRESYINAVDFLNDVLLPHFDEEMNKAVKKIDKEQKETLDKFQKEKKEGNDRGDDWIDKKLIYKRTLFQELNKLLFRKGYLADKKFSQ